MTFLVIYKIKHLSRRVKNFFDWLLFSVFDLPDGNFGGEEKRGGLDVKKRGIAAPLR